ncbi:hypothetical protein CHLRE_03g176600v5 [Chlamydomonas reinhardtii]|uniref:Uncharacterized protein n=1 Tax=Chlamydomonas reinhardtii TaxID=3055 RepID=A0A2K3DXH3_CHLRE|nr:uncharacterized protein CHLRE_03g176600v5 [Chlamydomonas reinhardtii]PNW85218.1 hypothetical protein CHLRE_03g176600v5 [Chlamydomonas reinhardtii]
MPAAGLSSGEAHIAHDRGHPTKEALDYSELPIQRAKSVVLPAVPVSMNYTNEDIPFSHPSATPLTSCYGLPRTFKAGSRCLNPLEPRYVLPGASAYLAKQQAGSGPAAAASTPAAAASLDSPGAGGASSGGAGATALPSPSRTASGAEGRLLPAVSIPRSTGGGGADSAAAVSSPKAPGSSLAPPLPPASPGHGGGAAASSPLGLNPHVTTNGAVGGLLLYGPGPGSGAGTGVGVGAGAAAVSLSSPSVAAIAAAAEASRCLNVTDINGPRRSTSTPPRRAGAAGGGFDPLHVSDIVSPTRRPSPTRHLSSLTTSDIRGATVRARTRDAASPGRGTLNSADIPGASPGCLARASPTTFALGRWPAPAVPQFNFPVATRVTMLKMPPNSMT